MSSDPVHLSRRGTLRAALATALSAVLPGGPALALPPAAAPTGDATGVSPGAAPAAGSAIGVTVRNQSVAPSCNGPENLVLTLVSDQVRRFKVEAHHPAYVTGLLVDRPVPAYLGCPSQPAPAPMPAHDAASAVRHTTLFETPDLAMVGYTLPDFWRRADVPVRVAEVATSGLNKLELWLKRGEKAATVIELFPTDGSWHLRPLPPAHLASTAFGAAVLIGPVTQEERPLVKLKEIGFAPQERLFTLHFAEGGSARVRLAGLDTDAIALDVELSDALAAPFGALRGRYVTQSEADISRLAWRTTTSAAFGEAPVMAFTDARDVSLLWAGRLQPARPAPSAPDLVFTGFTGA